MTDKAITELRAATELTIADLRTALRACELGSECHAALLKAYDRVAEMLFTLQEVDRG